MQDYHICNRNIYEKLIPEREYSKLDIFLLGRSFKMKSLE